MPATSILREPEAVRAAVAKSSSLAQALQLLGLRPAGGNYRALHEACARLGLEAPACVTWTPPPSDPVPDELVFCENSSFLNRTQIKVRLIRRGKTNECAECGMGPEWNGRPLVLQLDHVNGIYNDNREENLRLLCPNCHSQTETFTGRNGMPAKVPCRHCSFPNRPTAQRCSSCRRWQFDRSGKNKISWPEDEELAAMVLTTSYSAVGRKLGVTDSAVRKRLKTRRSAS
jgi:Zn finger protein HypA/HybF involved in hydrogenase expression